MSMKNPDLNFLREVVESLKGRVIGIDNDTDGWIVTPESVIHWSEGRGSFLEIYRLNFYSSGLDIRPEVYIPVDTISEEPVLEEIKSINQWDMDLVHIPLSERTLDLLGKFRSYLVEHEKRVAYEMADPVEYSSSSFLAMRRECEKVINSLCILAGCIQE